MTGTGMLPSDILVQIVATGDSVDLKPSSLKPGLSRRWLQLILGLAGFGISIPLMIRSQLGLGPWDAFHVGLHNQTGISIGLASILVGLVIVMGSYFLGIRPGPGTLANMALIGVFIDLVLPFIPDAPTMLHGLAYYAVGIVLMGISSGMYMGAGLGNGPRDALMLGLSLTWKWPVRRVRTIIELSALGGGWALGGAIGIGTLIFALSNRPAAPRGLPLVGALPPPAPSPSPPPPAPA